MDTQAKLYWHFVQVDENGVARLGYGDGREVKVGETLRVDEEPKLCAAGLHASTKVWDALRYANSRNLSLCQVTLTGTVIDGGDKSVASERTVVSMLDSDTTQKLLYDFGRWCALQVVHLWDAPEIMRLYLETDDESLRSAARSASAARPAARPAAGAWAAAWAAAGDWDASAVAARSAARSAAGAWDASADAAWDAAMAAAAARAASAAAACAADADADAAWDAELDRYTGELEQRALALMEAAQP